jgi:uncharacterized protein (TIGR02231 family)
MIKKIVLSLMILLGIAGSHLKARPNEADSRLRSVTVYERGAEIVRTAEITAGDGYQEWIVRGLPAEIMEGSLQVTGRGSFTILGTQFQKDYLAGDKEKQVIRRLRDSLEQLEKERESGRSELSILEDEKQILMANRQISGDQQGVRVEELERAMQYFREKLQQISQSEIKTKHRIQELDQKIERLKKQLDARTGSNRNATGQALIQIQSESPGRGTLEIAYVSMDAGWKPSYNIRASSIDDPVELIYQGEIYQTTGEDWDQVPLVISTGKAHRSNQQPDPRPVYVQFIPERPRPEALMQKDMAAIPLTRAQKSVSPEKEAEIAVSSVRERQIRTEYRPDYPGRIASDGKKHTIRLSNATLPAEYTYYAAPALDPDAFLLAKITRWERSGFLPGPASLFFENRYVGKSYIDPGQAQDTISLSLGRDPGIALEREPKQTYETDQLIGKNKTITYQWDIHCRNNKQSNIRLVLTDQLPVSTHQDIEVEALELSGASYNKKKGFLNWQLELEPGQSLTRKVRFAIQYPKDKRIRY